MSNKITESSFDRNYQKLLKGVSYLLFKNADNVRFIGSSRFKGVKAKEEKGINSNGERTRKKPTY